MDTNPDAVGDGASTASERRSSPGRAVGVAVAITILAVIVNTVGSLATLIPFLLLDIPLAVDSPSVFLALLIGGQLGFLAAGYAVARYRKMSIPIAKPDGRQVGIALGGAAVAIVVATVLVYVAEFFGVVPGSIIMDAAAADPTLFLWIAVLSVLLIAPVEEFFFRGVVQGTLREAFGPVGAVVGASLLFGSLHLANFTGNVATLVVGVALISVTGAAFGTLYEWTDSLTVPIIAHGVYNAVLLTGSYVVAA